MRPAEYANGSAVTATHGTHTMRGQIESSDPAMHIFATPANRRMNPAPVPTNRAATPSIFCDACTRRQALIVDAISRYLPDDDDPEYEVKLANYGDYRTFLETRYPPACGSCSQRVEAELRRQERALGLPSLTVASARRASVHSNDHKDIPYRKRLLGAFVALSWEIVKCGAKFLLFGIIVGLGGFSFLSWTRLFYEGLWQGLRYLTWPHRTLAVPSEASSKAMWRCTTSRHPFDEGCWGVLATHRRVLALQTAMVAFAIAEVGAYLRRSRKTAVKSATKLVDGRGLIYAALAVSCNLIMAPAISLSERYLPWSFALPLLYLCLCFYALRLAIGVLRLLIDPRERRLRRSLDSAGIIVAAEHLGNVLSGSQSQHPVEAEEHSSLFDRSDSAIDDLSVIDEPPDDEFVSKLDPSSVPRESLAAMQSQPQLESMAVAGISGLSLGGRPTNVWAPRYQQQAVPTQNGRFPAQPVNRTTAQNAATTGFARWRRNLDQNASVGESEILNQASHSALPRAHFGSPLEAARTQPASLTHKKWESATARSWDDGPMLAPQTFYPARDQSTGLETLFSSAARVRDPSWLEYIYSTWLSSALNGHERIAQRFLQLATIPGLFASWMVRQRPEKQDPHSSVTNSDSFATSAHSQLHLCPSSWLCALAFICE
ncbi:hypothetical protein BDZ88DRAFT_200742 [Geranomyces variabilis]|nr:hypothetical protein BDZ88DRAFT_200742 [Geranomyces variabilis]